jgi:hypothetical protein
MVTWPKLVWANDFGADRTSARANRLASAQPKKQKRSDTIIPHDRSYKRYP